MGEGHRIDVVDLTKTFGETKALDGLSFAVRPGVVTGFLGPNGAGKTTTLRCLLGLVEPTSGSATIDGRVYRDLPNPVSAVGAALEAASFHPGRTARAHLQVMALAGGLDPARADTLLAQAGLADVARRRVGGSSLGMRQRLALAQALLGDPPVLILDEPANGLDPAGIRWMRDLLRDYADRGGTVLLSSHLLHEIEVIADDIVVIGNGKIVAQGTKQELLAAAGSVVSSADNVSLGAALAGAGITTTVAGSGTLHTEADPHAVGRIALAAGIALTELRPADGAGLEVMFLDLTAESQRDDLEGVA